MKVTGLGGGGGGGARKFRIWRSIVLGWRVAFEGFVKALWGFSSRGFWAVGGPKQDPARCSKALGRQQGLSELTGFLGFIGSQGR